MHKVLWIWHFHACEGFTKASRFWQRFTSSRAIGQSTPSKRSFRIPLRFDPYLARDLRLRQDAQGQRVRAGETFSGPFHARQPERFAVGAGGNEASEVAGYADRRLSRA